MPAIPAKPAQFHPELGPVGCEIQFYSRWRNRPFLAEPPRLGLNHTNGGSGEGSLDGMSSWAERNVTHSGTYTIPHYGVDRAGRARKILPTNRRAICNATVLPGTDKWYGLTDAQRDAIREYPVNVSWWSQAIETADTGYLADPGISAFTPEQIETIATIWAYEYLVPGAELTLEIPSKWYGAGIGSHTDPFPYPFWTVRRGKICPGDKKKAQVRGLILPRIREIVAAWTGSTPTPTPTPTPPPTEDDDMPKRYLAHSDTNKYEYRRGDGLTAEVLRSNELQALKVRYDTGIHPGPATVRYYNPHTDELITSFAGIPDLSETQLDLDVGYLARHSQSDEG